MPVKEVSDRSEVDQFMAALITNAGAVRAVTEAVQGTLGPKGLDCMLVDEYGGVIITNDGVSILKAMDVNHPAARMVIGAAEHQETQVGDGTTTATIMAGALIAEGVNQVIKGVPVTRVIEGINAGIAAALEFLKEAAVKVDGLNSVILEQIGLVAGRNHADLAEMAVAAARKAGEALLNESGFKLADQVVALEGSPSLLLEGTIINKEPLNKEMPRRLTQVKVVIFDDALDAVKVESEALSTEAGFKRQLQSQEELKEHIVKLAGMGVKLIVTDRTVSEMVEDLLTDLGVIAVQRVAMREWRRLADLTGARPMKRGSLSRSPEELRKFLGEAAEVVVEEEFEHIKVFGLPGRNYVTMVVGGATREVVAERERIAKDAAAAVQAAWLGGVVPGGGGVELGIAKKLRELPRQGLNSYGFDCVIEALKRPMAQICANAGFNPLEKIEAVLAYPTAATYVYGVNCDTGAIENLTESGIWDPHHVKYHALKTAGEVCEAILRINTIIKMKTAAK